jgi:hypothetical protein
MRRPPLSRFTFVETPVQEAIANCSCLLRCARMRHNASMAKYHRFNFAVPVKVWKKIKALADSNRRPVTQEVLIAVEEYLERKDPK